MRSEDRTAAATIRDTAMELFAERGADAVTVRDIATAAGVSPALVIHHYKSKAGLREAVEERALETLTELLAGLAKSDGGTAETSSMAKMLAERLDDYPMLPAYLRRMLVDGGRPAERLFGRLYEMTVTTMRDYEAAGMLRPGDDDVARSAFLLTNDLGVIILRDQIAAVIGMDPLGPAGIARWTTQLMDAYTNGLFAQGKESARPGEGPGRMRVVSREADGEKTR